MSVSTQGQQSFKNSATSPFSDATNGVTSKASLTTETSTIRSRYDEYFKDTIMKELCLVNGDNLNAYNKFLYTSENWVNGNSFYAFHASTALCDEGDMRFPVYAAPFKVQWAQLAAGANLFIVGYSNGALIITQNGDIISSRWSAGTGVSTALGARSNTVK